MNDRGGFYRFFKSQDFYAAPVALTYNGKTKFPTFCGGVASLLTILVCLYWWTAVILTSTWFPQRNFTLSTKQKLVSPPKTPAPTYSMSQE